MTRRFPDFSRPSPPRPFISRVLLFIAAILATLAVIALLGPKSAGAQDCSEMRRYAQASANAMAASDHMSHDYFHRQPHVGAENVGWGYKSEAAMVAAWWRSPPHAANMRLYYPCKVIASSRSRSGKLYWAFEAGQ